MTVAFSSCSKKDVKPDEPGFSPSEGAAVEEPAPAEAAPSLSAGDASPAAAELETVYFGFDSFSLDNTARDTLKTSAQWLTDNPTATIQVEGHCDERGTTEYNLALGERRSNAAKDYLQKLGVDASRISVISYGEERPAEMGGDEAAWARNRRASFVVLTR
ncbi:peptidoglycan-associated lipoprotein Pal [bacterium]|nr:peptidoglycan-associated lipoprotein Pal [bacterium]